MFLRLILSSPMPHWRITYVLTTITTCTAWAHVAYPRGFWKCNTAVAYTIVDCIIISKFYLKYRAKCFVAVHNNYVGLTHIHNIVCELQDLISMLLFAAFRGLLDLATTRRPTDPCPTTLKTWVDISVCFSRRNTTHCSKTAETCNRLSLKLSVLPLCDTENDLSSVM